MDHSPAWNRACNRNTNRTVDRSMGRTGPRHSFREEGWRGDRRLFVREERYLNAKERDVLSSPWGIRPATEEVPAENWTRAGQPEPQPPLKSVGEFSAVVAELAAAGLRHRLDRLRQNLR